MENLEIIKQYCQAQINTAKLMLEIWNKFNCIEMMTLEEKSIEAYNNVLVLCLRLQQATPKKDEPFTY